MLVRELLAPIKDIAQVVDVSPGNVDLRWHLMLPDELPYSTADPADVTGTAFTPDTLLLCLIGPREGMHTAVGDLAPALRALPTGAKVLILAGWRPETFPSHLVLGPLSDARFQVTDAVPVDLSSRHGLHVALLAERVDELLPPHAYLLDVRTDDEMRVTSPPVAASDPLAVQLRAANEHLLGEQLVARSMRRRLRELEDRVAARTAELDATHERTTTLWRALTARDKDLARVRRRLRTLESSATYGLGRTLVDGARHPGKAVVSVPTNLAKIWRARRTRATTPASALATTAKSPAPTHRTVSIPVPGSPQQAITMTAPFDLMVPRNLATDGLARYETSAVPCFLAALDTAGAGAVFDIGANVGLYAALAAAVTDREVVAFEPFPTLSEVAGRLSADNDLDIRIESIALGREAGTATLYLSDSSDSSNSLAAGFRESSRQIEVPVETLDGYVQRTGAVPAVIKIDTESTEPDVLFGSAETLRDHRPWVLCEVLAGRVEERLTEVLAPHGYHWYHITDEVPYRHATVIEGDRTYRHLMWLFAPEPPDESFWAAVTAWRTAIAEAEPVSEG